MQTSTFIEMGFDEWVDKYRPVLDQRGDIRSFETFGDDLEIVTQTDSHYVWTWADGGDYSVIYNGTGFVNRLVYYVTEVPWEDSELVEIDMYQPDECEQAGHEFEKVERYDGKEYDCCKYCGEDREDIEQYA